MKSKNAVLLKTLLLSTSQWNCLKHSSDKKRRGRVVGNLIGMSVLFVCLMAYCIMTCIGYGQMGIAQVIPGICVLTISGINLLFTFFKSNGYLFQFKEYDMLMALPFEAKAIAGGKFLYMYIKSLLWTVSISLSMMIGYGIYVKPGPIVYVVWIILSAFIPIIPMLVASLAGYFIASISSHFKKTNLIQTFFTLLLVLLAFSFRFIIEGIARNGETNQALNDIAGAVNEALVYYLPGQWFVGAVTNLRIGDMLLLVGVSILAFEGMFWYVGRSYRQINSALKSHASAKAYKMTAQKRKSILQTIAYKEYKRMLGSTVYTTNVIIGEILAAILGVVALIFGFDKIIATITNGAPLTAQMLYPAIPLIIYFCIGMMTTTAVSPSLEGKNYWIIQSLPIDKKVLYQGKMLFQMYLAVPFMAFATICVCISAKVPFLNMALYLVEGFVLCAFSSAWGIVCGMKHMRLDWENEVEVVKQGAAVAIYMLPNMFITMGLVVLVVFLGLHIDGNLISLLVTGVAAVLAVLSFSRAMALTKRC